MIIMSDDEDDYMSDKFLAECCNAQNDVRPGLIKSHAEQRTFQALKRKHEQDEINRKKNPNMKLLELEKRKEGLEKPIEESNKGFAMLQKMGYKPGSGIGKKDAGRTEPVPIELKADREGLGRARARQEKYEEQIKEIRKNTVSTSEYRSRMTEKAAKRQVESDLRKSQRMCERFDAENDIFDPVEQWYWFSTDPENEDSKSKQKQDRNAKRKKSNLDFDDEPSSGVDSDDDLYDEELDDSDEEDDEEDELPLITIGVNEKLWDITTYLRNKYFYCIWCSVKYTDEDDLKRDCPGRTRDDH